jgi:hypothetical protein
MKYSKNKNNTESKTAMCALRIEGVTSDIVLGDTLNSSLECLHVEDMQVITLSSKNQKINVVEVPRNT